MSVAHNRMQPAIWAPGIRQGHPLARGLVTAWPWATSANQMYDVVGIYHLSASNGPSIVPSSIGTAWDFSRTSSQYYSATPSPLQTASYTMAAWFYVGDTGSADRTLIACNSNANVNWSCVYLNDSPPEVSFLEADANNTTIVRSGVTHPVNEWTLGVGIRFSATMRQVWCNLDFAEDTTDIDLPVTDSVSIGRAIRENELQANYMDGLIACPMMWSRALTAAEVQWLYEDPWDMFRPRQRSYFWTVTDVTAGTEAQRRPFHPPFARPFAGAFAA